MILCTKVFVVILLRLMYIVNVQAGEDKQDLHDEGKLHKKLNEGYRSEFRPVKDYKTAVQVEIRFGIKYISFDALEETFTVHSWVGLTWKDEFLNWAPSDYSDIKEIQMQSHEIWTPQMALLNKDATVYQSHSLYTTCMVKFDGTVSCMPHLAHSGICRTALRRWPYDVQNCTLYFGSWLHTEKQVNYTFYQKQPVDLDNFQNGPGWQLLEVVTNRSSEKYSCCPNNTYPILKYTYIMKREAAGPAAIVVVPSVVIILLTLVSLLLDIKDNNRLMLICFSLFGHFTFLQEIGYDIPKHSADTPIILLFVRDSMVITLVGILETIFLMSLRKRTEQAPKWVVSVTRLATSGAGKYVMFAEFDPSNSDQKSFAEDRVSSLNEEKARAVTDWVQFASLLNSFLFIISVFVYLILIFAYIPYDN